MAKKTVLNNLDSILEHHRNQLSAGLLTEKDIKSIEKELLPLIEKESDTNRIKICILLHNIYKKFTLDDKFESIAYRLVSILTQKKELVRLGKVYQDLGIHYRILGKYELSLEYIKKSLDVYERNGESSKIGDALNSLANYYYEVGEYSLAIEHYHKALEKLKLYTNLDIYNVTKGNLAELYKSLSYFQKARDLLTLNIDNLRTENNYFHYAKSLQGISEIYLEEGQTKLAYKYCKLAIENWEKVDSPLNTASVYATLGSVLSRFEKYDEAIAYYEKSKAILEKYSYRYEIIKLQFLFGTTYLDLRQYKNAISHLEQAEAIALKINQRIELRRIYNSLYKAYEGAGDNEKAYETIKKLTHLNDTMFNFSLQAKVNEVQVNFELEKKEIETKKEIEISHYRMKALLHQMNPHFIFNSMSTIQNLIIHHDIEECLEYIATLSRLMRAMLQNSRQETISLENELKFIQQYIDLELIRYQNSFDVTYELHLSSEDISETHIPTMMIQPILENAIKHGVSNLEDRRGCINMNFSYDTSGSYLAIKVEDNGYGVPTESNHQSHVSTAIDIIKERLNIYHVNNRNGTYQMNTSREGTIVEMKIPI